MTKINLTLGDKEYFKGIGQIPFEGKDSDNPLAYKYYEAGRVIAGKTMKEYLRFAVAYWHSFCGTGGDPFGLPTKAFPWLVNSGADQQARDKMDAAFEFITKLGLPFYCFHDFDLVNEGPTLKESARRLDKITDYAAEKQKASGVQLLWGTASLFTSPRYMNGAMTNPDFEVLAYAGAQVKNALDATIKLGGLNYVFWGGREGYMSLLNTNMKKELDHTARFLHMVKDYAGSQGFTGKFFIEPKPMEPSKHQYDFDAATVTGFLREHDLMDDFQLNLEVNHATLAQHTFSHELQVAANAGLLGSIDANRGDYQNGWDTDQFPNNLLELVESILVIIEAGGITQGGINFDARTRRNSTDLEDLFYAHIGGIDTFSRALLIAHDIIDNSKYCQMRADRYASYNSSDGQAFEKGNLSLAQLSEISQSIGEPKQRSGQQEFYENLINQYIQ